MAREQQILACSGVLYPPADWPSEWNGSQLWQATQLSGAREAKVCVVATAVGDAKEYISAWLNIAKGCGAVATHLELFTQPNVLDVRAHLLAQDVIFVTGGSVANLLAVWRGPGVGEIIGGGWGGGGGVGWPKAGSPGVAPGGGGGSFPGP